MQLEAETTIRAPRPLLLSAKEVDALYDTLEVLLAAFASMDPPVSAFLLAGSLLGSVRSTSILFCDDDVDIGIFECDAERVAAALPALLRGVATFARRPWPGGDRVRPCAAPGAWIDVFTLRRYENAADVASVVALRVNGTASPPDAIATVLAGLAGARYPIWHYDNRLALELWPREWLSAAELFPLRSAFFGPTRGVLAPLHPVPYLLRAFGDDCFDVYKVARQHEEHAPVRAAAAAAAAAVTALPSAGTALPLEDEHFLPVQHSKRARRVPSVHTRAALGIFLASEATWDGSLAPGAELPQQPLQRLDVTGSACESRARFGAAIAAATESAPGAFTFTAELRAAMEPHIQKARLARNAAAAAAASSGAEDIPTGLRGEAVIAYDAAAHPLGEELAIALGVAAGMPAAATTDMRMLHTVLGGAKGKHAATARLRCADARAGFVQAYDAFLARVVCPAVAAAVAAAGGAPPSVLRCQAFPCVRIIMPGEFSLAPHCDADRGFLPATVNIVVPLTKYELASGAAALHTETAPGSEDWHAVTAGPGELLRFYGNRCLHWTAENTTTATRVSLDLRVALLSAHALHTDAFGTGYFAAYRCNDGVWERAEALPLPDYRLGYPFGGVRTATAPAAGKEKKKFARVAHADHVSSGT